ncbi:IS110 family transposase [Micromonospora psammae]|uniref:IS110 family transposase n=1 Tax=Micromonospora sp. CPCC 205556 TaxID=3122398 RepID=UPI002FF370F1
MSILAEQVDVVIGVDAHTDTHTAAVVSAAGAVLAELTVPADDDGAAALLAWTDDDAGALRRQWVIDGARSHGVGVARVLLAAGETVPDAARVPGSTRRCGGKSDRLDAIQVARGALTTERITTPRSDGDREALRILHVARRHYTDTRTATVNLLKSLILTDDDCLRGRLRKLNTDQQVRHLCRLEPTNELDALTRVRHDQLRALAVDIAALDRTLAANLKQLRDLVTAMCPVLLEQPGVGPVSAAVALTAWCPPPPQPRRRSHPQLSPAHHRAAGRRRGRRGRGGRVRGVGR